jgi:hypothetical protein
MRGSIIDKHKLHLRRHEIHPQQCIPALSTLLLEATFVATDFHVMTEYYGGLVMALRTFLEQWYFI